MMRFGSVCMAKPERYEDYKKYHAAAWPEVNAMITACHIQNYSIYAKDGILFTYFEYTGDDYDGDMARMAADPTTQKWWDLVKPCMEPLATRKEGEWWADMEEIYHLD